MSRSHPFLARCSQALAALQVLQVLQAQSVVRFSAQNYTCLEEMPNAFVTLQRDGEIDRTVTVEFLTRAIGTASVGLDYLAVSNSVTFLPGETNRTVSIPILNDGLWENVETFQAAIGALPAGASLGWPSNALVRIQNNDFPVVPELTAYSVNEDAGSLDIVVLRRDDGKFHHSVAYSTIQQTAVAGKDFVPTSGVLEFRPGEIAKTITLTLLNDVARENNETFQLGIMPVNAPDQILVYGTVTITIIDTDDLVGFQTRSVTNHEGAEFVRVILARGESDLAGTVDVATQDATAVTAQDYVGITNTIAFSPGERRKMIEVPILQDGLQEASEKFGLVLSNPTGGLVLGQNRTMSVTILDNDGGIGFEDTRYSVWERAGSLKVNVMRGNDEWLEPFEVGYRTVDGTALAGIHYRAASGTLSFGANERVKSLELALLQDPSAGPPRSFTLQLDRLPPGVATGRTNVSISIVDSVGGHLSMEPIALRGVIERYNDSIGVTWSGQGSLLQAESLLGPWEALGATDSPLFMPRRSAGLFYQVHSPRPAHLYLPSSYDGRTLMPLMLVLHAYGRDSMSIRGHFRMDELADSRGFLVCYPDGTFDSDGDRFWNATPACCNFTGSTVDDSAYLRGLIEEVAERYPVDRKRIYVLGHSNGGFMAHRMAYDHGDLVAGIVSLAGAPMLDAGIPHPLQPVNMIQIHGTADDRVPFAGHELRGLPRNGGFPGAVETAALWAGYNGCAGPRWDSEVTFDLDLAVPGPDTVVLRYATSPRGGDVELWSILGGGHDPALSGEFATRVVDWLLQRPKP